MRRFFVFIILYILFPLLSSAQTTVFSYELGALLDNIGYLEQKIERLEERIEKAKWHNRNKKAERLTFKKDQTVEKLVSLHHKIVSQHEGQSYFYTKSLYELVALERVSRQRADSMLYERDVKVIAKASDIDFNAYGRLAEVEYNKKNYRQALVYNLIFKEKGDWGSWCGNANFQVKRGIDMFSAKCYEALGQIDSAINLVNGYTHYNGLSSNEDVIEYWADLINKKYTSEEIQKELKQLIYQLCENKKGEMFGMHLPDNGYYLIYDLTGCVYAYKKANTITLKECAANVEQDLKNNFFYQCLMRNTGQSSE